MKLTVLGCSGSMSGPTSTASSYLVQAGRTSVLLDLGPGSMGRLISHLSPCDLDGVVLSHLHADHMVDMIGLHVFCRWYPDRHREEPLVVLAPGDARERVRGVGGDGPEEDYPEFDFRRAGEGVRLTTGDLEIETIPVRHTVEAYAVRVSGPREDGQGVATLTYSGDTDACDNLVEAARDVDLLLCEAAFQEGRDAVRGVHLTGRRAGETATAAGAHRLVLTHLQPWNDPAVTLAEAREAYAGPADLAFTDATYLL